MKQRNMGESFKKIGSTYQQARREYPQELIEYIKNKSHLSKSSSVLDVGCGTGKSTIPFAKSSGEVIGIDISKKMLTEAKTLSSKYSNVTYKFASFEDAHFPKDKFDLILFGTSFHWVDPNASCKKIHSLLKDEGHLAIFWSSDPKRKTTLVAQINDVFAKNVPNFPQDFDDMEEGFLEGIKKSNLFEDVQFKKYPIIERYTKEQFRNLVKTYSWFIPLDKTEKEILLSDMENVFSKYKDPLMIPKEYKLIIAKKKTLSC